MHSEDLARYFRAMIWLGRTDLRVLDSRAEPPFQRRQLEAMVALRALVDDAAFASWSKIDHAATAFVGEPDAMDLRDVDSLLGALHVGPDRDISRLSDDAIAAELARQGLGKQRISSQLAHERRDPSNPEQEPVAFEVMPQRFTIDSEVLSNVVHDRIPALRLMPSTLDVAYAVLGNDAALPLLQNDLQTYGYMSTLKSMRDAADARAHSTAAVAANGLYSGWLASLRALSVKRAEMPSVAKTDAWGARTLGTELASWAELRHDTILYAKQSYTVMVRCEFPDAYVDPYPEFFARVADYGRSGQALMQELSPNDGDAKRHFDTLVDVATRLGAIANEEMNGAHVTPDELAWVNKMIRSHTEEMGCTEQTSFDGWYSDLFVDRKDLEDFAPTIADVHTQPTDEGGNMVGRVLHVGTGMPREMVVTIDSCPGESRAFVGWVSSYYETITQSFERLDDPTWQRRLASASSPTWLSVVTAP
jgi:hypothetical protein